MRRNPFLTVIFPHAALPYDEHLDGGGIRGLSSLYILQQLMEKVKQKESELDKAHRASGSDEVRLVLTAASSFQGRNVVTQRTANEDTEDWRPCQYFDFIVGTSTGG